MGDITSNAVIADGVQARFAFVAREPLVASGMPILPQLFAVLDGTMMCELIAEDGEEAPRRGCLPLLMAPPEASQASAPH